MTHRNKLPPESSVGDASMRAAILSVLACGLCFAVVGFAAFGAMTGVGVLLGGLLATGNLVVFARVGQAFVARKGNTAPWGVVAVLKMVLLFGGVWLVLRTGVVSALSLAAGYAALPFGITLASLFGPTPPEAPEAEDETDGDPQTRDAGGRDVVKGRPNAGGDPDEEPPA
jgi:hypothetical protein